MGASEIAATRLFPILFSLPLPPPLPSSLPPLHLEIGIAEARSTVPLPHTQVDAINMLYRTDGVTFVDPSFPPTDRSLYASTETATTWQCRACQKRNPLPPTPSQQALPPTSQSTHPSAPPLPSHPSHPPPRPAPHIMRLLCRNWSACSLTARCKRNRLVAPTARRSTSCLRQRCVQAAGSAHPTCGTTSHFSSPQCRGCW